MITLTLDRVSTIAATPALTRLAEDEVLFRDSVYEFADKEVRPLAREMDEQARMSPELIKKLFDIGVMSIEIPESYGGAGGSFFHSVLAVESVSRVDPSVGVLVDVQNTLVINALLRWGSDEHQAPLPAEAGDEPDRRVLPVGGRLRLRRVCADHPRGGTGRRLRAHRTQALDHQRRRSRPLHRVRQHQSRGGLPRHHRVHRRARHPRASASARRKTSSASAPAARAS